MNENPKNPLESLDWMLEIVEEHLTSEQLAEFHDELSAMLSVPAEVISAKGTMHPDAGIAAMFAHIRHHVAVAQWALSTIANMIPDRRERIREADAAPLKSGVISPDRWAAMVAAARDSATA